MTSAAPSSNNGANDTGNAADIRVAVPPSSGADSASTNNTSNNQLFNRPPVLIVASIASSVLLILSMKRVLSQLHFPYVVFLSSCHFLCTLLFTRFIANAGKSNGSADGKSNASLAHDNDKNDKMPVAMRWQMGALGALSVVSMNVNLQTNSVGVYQLSKLLCIPYMVAHGRYYYGRMIRADLLTTLALILGGVGMATVTDLQVSLWGVVVALIAVIVTAQFQLWQGSKQQEYGLNAVQMTDTGMMYSFVVCVLIGLKLTS